MRERLSRLDTIASLLNADNIDEATEIYSLMAGQEADAGQLSRQDTKRLLRLRIDLPRRND